MADKRVLIIIPPPLPPLPRIASRVLDESRGGYWQVNIVEYFFIWSIIIIIQVLN